MQQNKRLINKGITGTPPVDVLYHWVKQQTQHLGLIIIDIQTCTQGGIKMTKAEIVEKVAEIKVSKAAAARALAVVTGSITDAIRKGGKVTLVGFGTFSVAARSQKGKKPPRPGKRLKLLQRRFQSSLQLQH